MTDSSSSSSNSPQAFIVVGAGVIGLTTALSLRSSYPLATISILAAHWPGDYTVEYTSPWAGGNWCSSATDSGLLESFDRVTFGKFSHLARTRPECGIARSPLRMVFDAPIERADVLSEGTGKVWYEELVGGLAAIPAEELPRGAVFGYDVKSTFVINTQVYLRWLLAACRSANIKFIRQRIKRLDEARAAGKTSAIFNCTGLGSYFLEDVLDKNLYPSRGQTVLVEEPIEPLQRMYFRSPRRSDDTVTYVFQRPLGGGIVLGGCRQDGSWDGEVDHDFAGGIMERCCALAPELGRPEDLKVIRHGVGLRPGRRGGPRVELERRDDGLVVVHNYGAGGTGYQASWGMAEHGVKLFMEASESMAKL